MNLALPFTLDAERDLLVPDLEGLVAGDTVELRILVHGLRATDTLAQVAFTAKVSASDADSVATTVRHVVQPTDDAAAAEGIFARNGVATQRLVVLRLTPAETARLVDGAANRYDLRFWVTRDGVTIYRTTKLARVVATDGACDLTEIDDIDPVAAVAVQLADAGIQVGETTQASATLTDATGDVLTVRTVVWSSLHPTIATVHPVTGVVTAVGEGTATIVATSEGVSGTAQLTVSAADIVFAVTLTPASGTVAAGSTLAFNVTVTADGAPAAGVVVALQSSAPGAATVPATATTNGSGVATFNATGVAAGSATITAAYSGASDTSALTVTADASTVVASLTQSPLTLNLRVDPARVVASLTQSPLTLDLAAPAGGGPIDPGVPEGTPQPLSADAIYLDTRTTLQAATTFDQAMLAVAGPMGLVDHTGEQPGPGQWGLSFVKNFDGTGRNAIAANLIGPHAGDQGTQFISYLQAPKPNRLYIQWRSRLGRHANDPASNGAVDDFPMYPETQSVKRLLVARAGVGGGGTGRWDYVWTRHNPTQLRAQIDTQGWSAENSVGGGAWSAHDHVAEEILTTVYYQAASTDAAADGIIRVWIGGELHFERNDVPALAHAFDRFQLPTVYHQFPRACTEYVWDVLAWAPAT